MIHEKDIVEAVGLLARLVRLKKGGVPYCEIVAIRLRLAELGVQLESVPA